MFLVMTPLNLLAQESPGLTQGNFSGSQLVHLNPSNLFQSRVFIDVQLGSVMGFGQNNSIFIPANDFRTYNIFGSDVVFPSYEKGNNFTYRKDEKLRSGAFVSRIGLLSGMYLTGDHAFAINTSVRSFSSIRRVPFEIPVFGVMDLNHTPLHNIRFRNEDMRMASMVWGEIGFTYAYTFSKFVRDHWAAGITLKGLFGFSGAFMKVDAVDYIVVNDETIHVLNLDATAGIALPVDYNNNNFPPPGSPINGSGLGLDLGITYTLKKYGIQVSNPRRVCEEPFNDYEFRLGVSLIDIGVIRFRNQAELHRFEERSLFWENVGINSTTIRDITEELSALFHEGNPDATLSGNTFAIGLPTALSVQFDYNLYRDWYLNGLIIQPLPIYTYSLVRPAQLAVTPRYETAWLEFGVPVSLYDYRLPRLGFFARLGILTFGTDRIGSWLGIADIDGLDFYASIKINLNRGKCLGVRDSGACAGDDNYRRAMGKRPGWR